jgi:hypothetical protein
MVLRKNLPIAQLTRVGKCNPDARIQQHSSKTERAVLKNQRIGSPYQQQFMRRDGFTWSLFWSASHDQMSFKAQALPWLCLIICASNLVFLLAFLPVRPAVRVGQVACASAPLEEQRSPAEDWIKRIWAATSPRVCPSIALKGFFSLRKTLPAMVSWETTPTTSGHL